MIAETAADPHCFPSQDSDVGGPEHPKSAPWRANGGALRGALLWSAFLAVLVFVFFPYFVAPVGHMDDYAALWNTSNRYRLPDEIPVSVKAFFADRRPVAGLISDLVVAQLHSASGFAFLRLLSLLGFASFFCIALPLLYGSNISFVLGAFLLVVSSGAFVANVNWALYFINALCYLFVGAAFWCYCRSVDEKKSRALLRGAAIVLLAIAVLMFQSTWLLFPMLVLMAGLAHPATFLNVRAVVAGAVVFIASLVLATVIAEGIEFWWPVYFLETEARDRFAWASLGDLPGRIDYFFSRPFREQIAFIGFRDLIDWPILLPAMLAPGFVAGYLHWRAGRKILALFAILAVPAALLWCNIIFFMLKKGNWPYRVHLPSVTTMVLINLLHLKLIAESFSVRRVLVGLPLVAASLGAVLFTKFVVVEDVHRSDLVELRLVSKFAASLDQKYDAVYVEKPHWNIKRARYMLYEDVGVPSLIAPWAVEGIFQLAYVEAHGEAFRGRFVQVSSEQLPPPGAGTCIFRSNDIMRKHRTLASVKKYVPSCD